MIFKVPSNPNHSMILSLSEAWIRPLFCSCLLPPFYLAGSVFCFDGNLPEKCSWEGYLSLPGGRLGAGCDAAGVKCRKLLGLMSCWGRTGWCGEQPWAGCAPWQGICSLARAAGGKGGMELGCGRPGFPLILRVPVALPWGRTTPGSEEARVRRGLVHPRPDGHGTGREVSPCPPAEHPGYAGTLGCEGPGFGRFSSQNQPDTQPSPCEPAVSPFPLLRASLIYGTSSENTVQKGVCRAGCARAINPDSCLVSLKGFWEPNIRHPRENLHGLFFSVCSLALFIYFCDDDDWKIKVTRQKSLKDTPTAAPRPGSRLAFVVE